MTHHTTTWAHMPRKPQRQIGRTVARAAFCAVLVIAAAVYIPLAHSKAKADLEQYEQIMELSK